MHPVQFVMQTRPKIQGEERIKQGTAGSGNKRNKGQIEQYEGEIYTPL